jgi:phosphatidylserine/phosphatidylglycerophosphate/cardiolipin synthase-like enzyme
MKSRARAVFFGILCAVIFAAGYGAASFGARAEPTILYSLDKRQNDRAILRLIDDANRYAYFAVYTFTKMDIADALIRAKRRGVDVQGITDLEQSQIPEEAAVIQKLRAAGIPVETQKHPRGIMHVKALVTDRAYAIGSYNWTWSATNVNDEILEIGDDENVRGQYFAIIKKVLAVNR